jgi:hypothetical protein
VKSQLLWSLNDDVLACRIPANHVVVFWALEETCLGQEERVERVTKRWLKNGLKGHLRIQFCQEGGLRFRVRFCHVVLLLLLLLRLRLLLLLLLLLTLLVLAVMLVLKLW